MPRHSLNTPTAFGLDWGTFLTGVSFQQRTRFGQIADGVAFGSLGFGDMKNWVAVEVVVSVVDLDPFGKDGTVGFKVHRQFVLDENHALSLAVGRENAFIWGSTDGLQSYYGVASLRVRLRDAAEAGPLSTVFLHCGIGDGRFRSELDIRHLVKTTSVFGGFALRVFDPLSVVANWSGQDLYAGISASPFRALPVFFSAAFGDLLHSAGDGPRFLVGAFYGNSFLTGEPPFRDQ